MSFFSLSQPKSLHVGIDLGVDAAKVICLKPMKGTYQLRAHALLKKEQWGILKEFLNHAALKQAEIRVSVQAPQLKVQQIAVPAVPREELQNVVEWAFKEATNVAIDEYRVRFYQTGTDAQSRQLYTAFAIEKAFFDKWEQFVDSAGIKKPKIAEPDIQSLANLAGYNYGFNETTRFAIIDIGKTQSQFAVVSNRGVEFFRPFSGIGGDPLASNVSVELGIPPEEAERRILDIGNDIACEKKDEILEIINGYCAKFCLQAQYAIEHYAASAKDSPISNIVLAGGGAKLKGIKDQIQDTLHYPTDLIDPFARLDLGRFRGSDFENSKTLYAVATGLAL